MLFRSKIEQHPQLASRLALLLPQGMTLDQAAMGFRNQGQFIAALYVSKNLGIAFADLKTQMVTDHKSLGQAIQVLRPTTNTSTDVELAETQARQDIDNQGPASTSPKSTGTGAPRERGDN